MSSKIAYRIFSLLILCTTITSMLLISGCGSEVPNSTNDTSLTDTESSAPSVETSATTFSFTLSEAIESVQGISNWNSSAFGYSAEDVAIYNDNDSKRLRITAPIDPYPEELAALESEFNKIDANLTELIMNATDSEQIDIMNSRAEVQSEITKMKMDAAEDSYVKSIQIFDLDKPDTPGESYQYAINAIMQCENTNETMAKEIYQKVYNQLRENFGQDDSEKFARNGDIIYSCNVISKESYLKKGFDVEDEFEVNNICISDTLLVDVLTIMPYGLFAEKYPDKVTDLAELTGDIPPKSEKPIDEPQSSKLEGRGFELSLPQTWANNYHVIEKSLYSSTNDLGENGSLPVDSLFIFENEESVRLNEKSETFESVQLTSFYTNDEEHLFTISKIFDPSGTLDQRIDLSIPTAEGSIFGALDWTVISDEDLSNMLYDLRAGERTMLGKSISSGGTNYYILSVNASSYDKNCNYMLESMPQILQSIQLTDGGEKVSNESEANNAETSTSHTNANLFDANGYVFADSSNRFLSREEVLALKGNDQYSRIEIMGYARNEIFARHGNLFDTPKYSKHYSQYSWYQALNLHKVQDSELNEYEKANIDLIKECEKTAGA
ncbi:YARHG domain-containing protein [Christensenella minuta]|uniref:YARHG domain-containing protein n=1 Tax=Christensenella minuta TaxID=626937 RepID=UPI0021576C40|nr:YARHG domain-containing protein [Christensenella minuta]